jgi:hypothetical protein
VQFCSAAAPSVSGNTVKSISALTNTAPVIDGSQFREIA